MRTIVVYFSQTGNTKKVAEVIASELGRITGSTDLALLQDYDPQELGKYHLIGLGTPVFYFREPINVKHFLKEIPQGLHGSFFLFATAGSQPGNIFPNMAKILRKKGIKVLGTFWCKGCDTYQAFEELPPTARGHPDDDELRAAQRFAREMFHRFRLVNPVRKLGREEEVLSNRVKEKKEILLPEFKPRVNSFYLLSLLFTEWMLKSLLFLGLLPVKKIDYTKCNRCGLCVENCPVGAVRIGTFPRFGSECLGCYYCAKLCPQQAITSRWGIIKTLVKIITSLNPRLKEEKKYRKILLIRLSSIGDIVLTTPVIKALKERFPKAEITFITKKRFADLLKENPDLSKLILFDEQDKHKGTIGLLHFLSELRWEDYDLLIDLHSNFRSFVFSIFVLAREKMRYRKRHFSRWLLVQKVRLGFSHGDKDKRRGGRIVGQASLPSGVALTGEPAQAKRWHTLDLYAEPIEFLGAFIEKQPHIFLKESDEKKIEELLADAGILPKDFLVGFSPGANWETKRWTKEGFAELGNKLIKENSAKVLLFGERKEKRLLEKISNSMPIKPVLFYELSLAELASAIKRCSVFVSNDSGPAHIATAVETPLVVIFGSTSEELGFRPLGKNVITISKEMTCRPCSLHGLNHCPKRHFNCMRSIMVEGVFEAVNKALQGI
ncbi:MAG: EFR1 family ferrodoxin [Candidatus Edwardsbacteria bacterium]